MTCWRSQAAVARLVDAFEPSVDLALGLVLGHAIALLESAAELAALAFDYVEVVVAELPPLLLNLALERLPTAFDTIPIHRWLLRMLEMAGKPGARAKVPMRVAGHVGGEKTASPRQKRRGRSRPNPSTTPLDNRPSTGRGKWAAGYSSNA